jgi:hypothetical protein
MITIHDSFLETDSLPQRHRTLRHAPERKARCRECGEAENEN